MVHPDRHYQHRSDRGQELRSWPMMGGLTMQARSEMGSPDSRGTRLCFAAGLEARWTLDLIRDDLANVVHQALEPAHFSVLIKLSVCGHPGHRMLFSTGVLS